MNARFTLSSLVRDNILDLVPYSSARMEYSGTQAVLLDANENPFDTGYNRYPDPLQRKLKSLISVLKAVPENNIFLGNGSDEAIDLLVRIFCNPGKDHILTMDPSYGMYEVCARIQDAGVRKIPLDRNFASDLSTIMNMTDERSKIIFLCSPNNPTGNVFSPAIVYPLLDKFPGLVVIDEAYQDFSSFPGFLPDLLQRPNLVILQTFSKAWGQAGIRLGMAFASEEIITLLNKVKYPYNLNNLTIQYAVQLTGHVEEKGAWVDTIRKQRQWLTEQLSLLRMVTKVFPSEANFLLVRFTDHARVFEWLRDHKIIVRDRSTSRHCEGCLRITVGTPEENKILVNCIKEIDK